MEQLELAIEEIKKELPGLTLYENEPMAGHCSFHIGGPARALAVPQDVTGLTRICYLLKKHEIAPYILGRRASRSPSSPGLRSRTDLRGWNLPPAFRAAWAAAS